jgi:1-acyl-sn-glycerol-3-phosphate acyltransferase
LINRIIAFFFLAFIGISSLVFYPVALLIWLVTVPFDPRLVGLHLFTCFWASLYTWIMPAWRFTIEGRSRVRKDATYIIVSNHQSQLDILTAFRLFIPFKWVSKAEVFRLPLIGWNMVLNGYIRLVRGDKESIRQMMASCEAALRRRCSIFMFPEGTRSRTGALRSFKPGAFILAHKLRLPLLPVVINGTRRALPKYSLNFHGKHRIRISVLEEIPYKDFKGLSVEETASMVQRLIASHVEA